MKVNIKKLRPNAIIPTYESECAAGLDLYADLNGEDEVRIGSHETKKVGTGIAVEIPDGYCGAIFARSGISTNKGLRPANCVGVIDSDYRGEIIVALHCDKDISPFNIVVKDGDRIAQLVILPYLTAELNEVDNLSQTARGGNGFGSTG